ncbi:unnamed protein product [Prorocentrum cordatum]|uniref:Uncharacterized protein n=1 Tax=Prorocentrum cordatum TaxID=2364126 RepID=A0ABN9Y7A6_9DINO|nr:unnamed protein product [Polarella glacialis]
MVHGRACRGAPGAAGIRAPPAGLGAPLALALGGPAARRLRAILPCRDVGLESCRGSRAAPTLELTGGLRAPVPEGRPRPPPGHARLPPCSALPVRISVTLRHAEFIGQVAPVRAQPRAQLGERKRKAGAVQGVESSVEQASRETVEEAMIRLGEEIEVALETENLAAAAKAQRELRQLQFDRPSATCQHLIAEECRRATCLLRQGDAVSTQERIQAAKKLGRWLRWQRFASKGLVPPHTVLEGLLCALRSQPEVAWTAQCALFHAARVAVVPNRSIREGPRGIITSFLLNEPTPFPLCMPDLSSRSLRDFQRALATAVVRSFFGQMRALTLIDPGYGDDPDREHMYEHLPFARAFGRNFKKVETLEMLGFEDVGIALFLPSMAMPELKCLRIVGALQTPMAQEALVLFLHRHGPRLTELVLNVWTEFLCDADDPLVVCDRMPNVKRLTVRAPPPVPWEHFAATFPNLEEVTFLYDQDLTSPSTVSPWWRSTASPSRTSCRRAHFAAVPGCRHLRSGHTPAGAAEAGDAVQATKGCAARGWGHLVRLRCDPHGEAVSPCVETRGRRRQAWGPADFAATTCGITRRGGCSETRACRRTVGDPQTTWTTTADRTSTGSPRARSASRRRRPRAPQ